MSKEYMISIIIPNYNGEKFIGRCLDSVLNQEEKRVEIIVVDDGSNDNSKEIIDSYHKKYDNIKTVYKENGGVSSARNEGIRHVSGKYILFLDSDDELEDDALTCMLNNIGSNDVLVFSYNLYDSKKDVSVRKTQIDTVVTGENYRRNLFYYITHTQFASPWNKLIRAELVQNNKVRFPEGVKVGEDYIFNLGVSKYVNSIKFINMSLYKYYDNLSSITHKLDMNRWKEQALTVKETYKLEPDKNEYEAEFLVKRFYNTYITYAYCLDKKQVINILKDYSNMAYKDVDVNNIKGKSMYRLFVKALNNRKYKFMYRYLWAIDHVIKLKQKIH